MNMDTSDLVVEEEKGEEYTLFDDLIDQVHCLPPILLVGKSGSGKTTFVEKLIKSYEPDRVYRIHAPIRIQYNNSKVRFITELNRMFLNQTSLRVFIFVQNCHLLSDLVQKGIAHRLQFISNMVKFVGECSNMDPKGLHPSLVDVCQRVNFHSTTTTPMNNNDRMLWKKADKNHHIYRLLKHIVDHHHERMMDVDYWARCGRYLSHQRSRQSSGLSSYRN